MSPAGRHSYSRRRCGAGSATVERDGQMDGRTVRQTDRRRTDRIAISLSCVSMLMRDKNHSILVKLLHFISPQLAARKTNTQYSRQT